MRSKVSAGFGFILCATLSQGAEGKGLNLNVSVPVIVGEAKGPFEPETVGLQEVFGSVPARYRSAITLLDNVTATNKPLDFAISAGDILVEAVSDDQTLPIYCTARRVKKLINTTCLADTDKDGALDRVLISSGGFEHPFLPSPSVRELSEIKPVRYSLVTDSAVTKMSMGYYVSGTNPLMGQHHFYPVLAKGDGSYPLIEEHRAVSTKALPKTVNFQNSEIEVTGYSEKRYTVRLVKPIAAGTLFMSAYVPIKTMWIYIPR